MKKIFRFIKEKFLTKAFLSFIIIGVLNTIINFLLMEGIVLLFGLIVDYDISTKEAGFMYYLSMGLGTLVSFIGASVFSYQANARFTYKQKERDKKTSLQAALTYVVRFVFTYLLTLLLWWLAILIFRIDTDPNGLGRTISNLIASILMIPPTYLVLQIIFKYNKKRIEEKENI